MLTHCISTYNNLPYLKLAVESVRKNSYFKDAPFIIHAENCTDGTYQWLADNGVKYNLTVYIKDLIISTIDDEVRWLYRYHIHWTQNDPYVWIAGSLKENGIHRYKPNLKEVEPIIKQIVAYLNSEGFSCEINYFPNKENCKQFFIYFKEK